MTINTVKWDFETSVERVSIEKLLKQTERKSLLEQFKFGKGIF